MNKTLPFKLYKYHKTRTKYRLKRKGMIFTEEEFNDIYEQYIYATNCDLCNKPFNSTCGRQIGNNQKTKKIKNILCYACNIRIKDTKMLINSFNHKDIFKHFDLNYKEGFRYDFILNINGKYTIIKTSTDINFLIKFAEKWKKENNY